VFNVCRRCSNIEYGNPKETRNPKEARISKSETRATDACMDFPGFSFVLWISFEFRDVMFEI